MYVLSCTQALSPLQAHLFRLIQVNVPVNLRDQELASQGLWQIITFNVLTFMLLICLVLAVVTPPGMPFTPLSPSHAHVGSIPDKPEWTFAETAPQEQPVEVQTALETKKSGDRRFCKWRCGKFKPDRAHHCRMFLTILFAPLSSRRM